MNGLCKFSDIFGKPNEGIHSYRLFNLAIVDIILTLVGAYFIYKKIRKSLVVTFFALWGIGTILHLLFCVKTPITNLII